MTTTAETIPARDDLLNAARGLHDRLREFAGYGDTHRRTADEVVDALTAAGMFRLSKPRRYGGYELDLGTFLEILEILGEADGSAAWLVAIAAMGDWCTAHAPSQAMDEVFGADPDARLAGGGAAAGAGRPVDGGVVVTGRWSYASGSPHAQWAIVAAGIVGQESRPPDLAFVLMPITDVEIEDTWYTAGLRGTGSNTLVAADVFVPEHRVIPWSSLTEEAPSSLGPLYRLPMQAVGRLGVVGPLLGVARAALTHVIDATAVKGLAHTAYRTQRESVGVQLQVADAALKLQTASLHAHAVADTLMRHAIEARPLDGCYLAQSAAETTLAGEQILAAANGLMTVHGAGGLADTNPLQRMFRDINTGVRHAALNPVVSNEIFGKALLGMPTNDGSER
ncbi:acyl-CoA dehydrogenase family protein [Mycobacterium sp. NPDC003449]